MRGTAEIFTVIACTLIGCGISSSAHAYEPQEMVGAAVGKASANFEPSKSVRDTGINIRQPRGRNAVLPESPYAERRRDSYRNRPDWIKEENDRRSGRERVANSRNYRALPSLNKLRDDTPELALPTYRKSNAEYVAVDEGSQPPLPPVDYLTRDVPFEIKKADKRVREAVIADAVEKPPIAAAPTLSDIQKSDRAQAQILTPMEELAPASGTLLALPGFDEPLEEKPASDPVSVTQSAEADNNMEDSGPAIELPPFLSEVESVLPGGADKKTADTGEKAKKETAEGSKFVVVPLLEEEKNKEPASADEVLAILKPQGSAEKVVAAEDGAVPVMDKNTFVPFPANKSVVAAEKTEKDKEKSKKLAEQVTDDIKTLSENVKPDSNAAAQEEIKKSQDKQEAQNIEKQNTDINGTTQKAETIPVLSTHDEILDSIASSIKANKIEAGEVVAPIDVRHDRPAKVPQVSASEVKTHEAMGISIEVKTPPPNVNYQLEQAYNALIGGYPERAVEIYRDVLSQSPDNISALFGLATTYHRIGELSRAREFYGRLLALDPKHNEAISNYLGLLAEESPGEAMEQLIKLESSNPDYSPVVAQQAAIYEKSGDFEMAVKKIMRAVELSPENLSYRYNYAVLLDKSQKWGAAAKAYQQLITASETGQPIPGNVDAIQERLTFIMSNKVM